MAYQLYRNTTLGNSLQESLDELIQTQQITPQLALQVLLQFDKAINTALANRVRNRVNFRGSLNTYRFCDNVWTFVLNDVEFREVTDLVKVDKVKIVACDGKNSGSNAAEWLPPDGVVFYMDLDCTYYLLQQKHSCVHMSVRVDQSLYPQQFSFFFLHGQFTQCLCSVWCY